MSLLPTAATAQTTPTIAPGGGAGADQQGTASFAATGPTIVGPDYIAPLDMIADSSRTQRLIADSDGHLLVQGRDDDGIDQLIAVDAADGAIAWTLPDIDQGCQPVAADDGRIFAQYVLNSDSSGQTNFSADPVEIDATTGTVVNRYTSPDSDEFPRIGTCLDGLRLGADDVLIAHQGQSFDYQVVGFDTSVMPMTEIWRYDADDSTDFGAADRIVLSPDGTVVTYGKRLKDGDEISLQIEQIDVATGEALGTTVVPGTTFVADGLVHTGTDILVVTTNAGGQDDPNRLVSLDAQSLEQNWVTEGVEDTPLDGICRIALVDDVIAVHTCRDIVGLDVTDGSVQWEAPASSFTNNGAQLVGDGAGHVYFSSFGGSPLEVLDAATGTSLFIAPDDEDFLGTGVLGEAATLGPVLDNGRLYALHASTEDRPVLVAYGSGTARLDGGSGEPIDIAIQLCQYLFADDGARTVVLSRDDVFADTLAGAPLAGDDSCILFTPGGPDALIDPRTLEEIGRALPDGATVRIAGGVNAVSQSAQDSVTSAGFAVERLEGASRVETAVAIARVVMAEGAARQPNGDTVAMVARADDWPDAVAGGAALSALGSPVLLTGTDQLHPATAAALTELGVTSTIIAGGTAAVSEAAAGATPALTRVSGPNRHATAAAFATQVWSGLAEDGQFVLANLEFDRGWALALAASPLSVRLGAPQLGVRADNLPVETEGYLSDAGVSDPGLIVLGDLTVIQDSVVDAVQVAGAP